MNHRYIAHFDSAKLPRIDADFLVIGLEALKAAIDALHNRPYAYDDKLPNGEIFTKTKFGPIRLITSANFLDLERMWPHLYDKK